ncbi:hypothetical protein COU80_04500 [Candidatus Peregrinibacteria bacterium CG10_big_fil_rev_8_21_14_0_10_55_24]|nr:MAG: hypothetical protein COU80_04500 [Candidatus Peregrinibacteria bacterium CG10_big_fil_rev_8_21_14_0_10_55_24]
MLTIAHVLSPFLASPGSELAVAQPVVFESMRRARALAAGTVSVEFLAVTFPEDASALPSDFSGTSPLDRSVLDMGIFRERRKLPLLCDILERAAAATSASYLIYTNVDICLMPHFYRFVAEQIGQGIDACTINRRTIRSRQHNTSEGLSLLYEEEGKPHPGYDCFVFRREKLDSFILGLNCLGIGHVELPLLCSMIALSTAYRAYRREHLTFHFGDSRTWRARSFRDYQRFNDQQSVASLRALLERTGKAQELPLQLRWMLSTGMLVNRFLIPSWRALYGQ